MTKEENNDAIQTMIDTTNFTIPNVDYLYFIHGRRYRCTAISQRVDDKTGHISMAAEFKREYTRLEELCKDAPGEVLDAAF